MKELDEIIPIYEVLAPGEAYLISMKDDWLLYAMSIDGKVVFERAKLEEK